MALLSYQSRGMMNVRSIISLLSLFILISITIFTTTPLLIHAQLPVDLQLSSTSLTSSNEFFIFQVANFKLETGMEYTQLIEPKWDLQFHFATTNFIAFNSIGTVNEIHEIEQIYHFDDDITYKSTQYITLPTFTDVDTVNIPFQFKLPPEEPTTPLQSISIIFRFAITNLSLTDPQDVNITIKTSKHPDTSYEQVYTFEWCPQLMIPATNHFISYVKPDPAPVDGTTPMYFMIEFTDLQYDLNDMYVLGLQDAFLFEFVETDIIPSMFQPRDPTLPKEESFQCHVINTVDDSIIYDDLPSTSSPINTPSKLYFQFKDHHIAKGSSIRIECNGIQFVPNNPILISKVINWSFTPANFDTTFTTTLPAQSDTAQRRIGYYYKSIRPEEINFPTKNVGFLEHSDRVLLAISIPINHGYEWVIQQLETKKSDFEILFASYVPKPKMYTKMTFANENEFYIQEQSTTYLRFGPDPQFSSNAITYIPLHISFCCRTTEETPQYDLSTVTKLEIYFEFPVSKASSMGVQMQPTLFPLSHPAIQYQSDNLMLFNAYAGLGSMAIQFSQIPTPPTIQKTKYNFQFKMPVKTLHGLYTPHVISLNGTQIRTDLTNGTPEDENKSGFASVSWIEDTNCFADVDLFYMPWLEPTRFIIPSILDIKRGIVLQFDETEAHKIPENYYVYITCPAYSILTTNEDRLHKEIIIGIEPYEVESIYHTNTELTKLYALQHSSPPLDQFCYEEYEYDFKTIVNAMGITTSLFQQLYHFPIDRGLQWKWDKFYLKVFVVLNINNPQCTFTTTAIYKDDKKHQIVVPCTFESFVEDNVEQHMSVLGLNGLIDWSPTTNPSPYKIEDLVEMTLQISFNIERTYPGGNYYMSSYFSLPDFDPAVQDKPTKFNSDFGGNYQFPLPQRHVSEMLIELRHSDTLERFDYQFTLLFPNITTATWEHQHDFVFFTNFTLPNDKKHTYFHPTVPGKLDTKCLLTSSIDTTMQYEIIPHLVEAHGLVFPMKDQKYEFTLGSDIKLSCPGWSINAVYNTEQRFGPFPPTAIVNDLISFTFQTYIPTTYPLLTLGDDIYIDGFITKQPLYDSNYDFIREHGIIHKSTMLTPYLTTPFQIELTSLPYWALSLDNYQYTFSTLQLHGVICATGSTQSVVATIITEDTKYIVNQETLFKFKNDATTTDGICQIDNLSIRFPKRINPGPDVQSFKLLFTLNVIEVVSPSVTMTYQLIDDVSWYRYQPDHSIAFKQTQSISTNGIVVKYHHLTPIDTMKRKILIHFSPQLDIPINSMYYLSANSTHASSNIFTTHTTEELPLKCHFIQYNQPSMDFIIQEGDIEIAIIATELNHAVSFKFIKELKNNKYTIIDCTQSSLSVWAVGETNELYKKPITYIFTRNQLPSTFTKDIETSPFASTIIHRSFQDASDDDDDDSKDHDKVLQFTTFPTIPITQYARSLGFTINNLPIDAGTRFNLTMKINNVNIVQGDYHYIRTNFTCVKDGLTASISGKIALNLNTTTTEFNDEKHYIKFTTSVDFGTCVIDAKTTALELGFDLAVYDINIKDGVTYDFNLKTRNEQKGGETIFHPPSPLSLPTSPILASTPKMTYTNTTSLDLGNSTITRFCRHFSPIEIPAVNIDLNQPIQLTSNGTRINNDLIDPKSFFELLPNKNSKDDKLCEVYDLKKEKKVYGKVIPIQDKYNKTLSFDFSTSTFQRIIKGDSIGINCPNWFIRAAPGTRNQTLSYTISTLTSMDTKVEPKDQSETNTVSWVMEPMGYGPDEDYNPPKPKKKSHTVLIVVIVLIILAVVAAGVVYYLKFYKKSSNDQTVNTGLLNGDYADLE